jgi:signal transduction histidine kinase
LATIVDVTERQAAQTLETLLEILPIPTFVATDRECMTIRLNSAAAALCGVSTNENISQTAAEAGRAPVIPIYRAGARLAAEDLPLQRAAATGEAQHDVMLDVERPSGERYTVMGSAAPLFDDLGVVRGAVAVFTDVTPLRATIDETSDQLLSAQERERQRIAIELHDSMSQHLAGLALDLIQLRRRVGQDAAGQALIEEMSTLTQQAVQETRVLSYLMNAARGKRERLGTSIHRLVEGFGRRAGLKASFETKGPVDAVSADVRHAVFRVVEEALSNVYRHAQATEVSVRLASETGVLTASVADNGRGIPLAAGDALHKRPLGVGISGMRARLEQLNGDLKIVPGEPRGAVVIATVPLRRRGAARGQREPRRLG